MEDLAKCKRAYWAAKTQAKIRGKEWKYTLGIAWWEEKLGANWLEKRGERKKQICNGPNWGYRSLFYRKHKMYH